MAKNFLEVQSLQRALDLLEAIAGQSRPVPLREAAAATGLPKSTAYRLLGNLEHRGYVRCNQDGSYQLGLKFLVLSQQADQRFELKQLVRPFMLRLSELTRETIHLGMLQQGRVIYVDTIDSPQPIRLVACFGPSNPVHCTALGKALLMHTPDAEIGAMLAAAGMERRTAYSLVSRGDFLADMERVRQRGYALDDMESALECRCVGAPIYDHDGNVAAALSVSGPASRFSLRLIETEVAGQLLDVTGQISRFLGTI
ncbi:MAG: IclR family transcriptional regulator [Sporomusaceae bacterium]|nr:IclR family transcriptional regulator [Sporomusaceae bacterium]